MKLVWGAVGLAALLSLQSKATETMPAAQQNAVVQRYCGSCHSDALMYGGLSVEHFDAARPDPTVAAMLVSKLTSGLTPKEIIAADSEATVLGMARGAMGAAGDGVPDDKTQVAFVKALSMEAASAEDWHSRWDAQPLMQWEEVTASIVRELPSTVFAGKTDMYRLILTCRVDSHEGEIKLAWANGVPAEGRELTVEVDGEAPLNYKAEGGKKQGNGINGPGSTILYPSPGKTLPLPAKNLTVRDVFPNETVEFPFENLSQTDRRDLSICFAVDTAY